MKFVALDVETANADLSSICQVGIARFNNGNVEDEWVTLIDPQSHFDMMNVSVHGIEESDVVGAPTFGELASELTSRLQAPAVVTHTHFDRVALQQACSRLGHPTFDCRWLDSARVARRAWNEVSKSGYGLANVCDLIGYSFLHHDALEDAKAAGQIILAASAKTGLDIDGWLRRVQLPLDLDRQTNSSASSPSNFKQDGNPDGPMSGETIVFTGALSIARREASELAAKVGCDVGSSVTKKTTILCVGDQDVSRLAGNTKSSKHRKAESLIEGGQSIRIVRETDFVKMVEMLRE